MKIRIKKLQAVKMIIMGWALILTSGIVHAEPSEITQEDVVKAQKAWADGLVHLGKTYTDGRDYQKAAESLVDRLYAYQTGQVLFKPTKAAHIKFRTTKEGAISYFIGHNNRFPEDKGFALEPWTNVRFKNAGIYINGNVAMAMGEYFFTPQKGDVVNVDYTFGYVKNNDGTVKIVLHHSSLPYTKK